MRAAVMEGVRKPLVVQNVSDPKPAPTGAVVRVEANGICRSDWHAWTGDWTWLGVSMPPLAKLVPSPAPCALSMTVTVTPWRCSQ